MKLWLPNLILSDTHLHHYIYNIQNKVGNMLMIKTSSDKLHPVSDIELFDEIRIVLYFVNCVTDIELFNYITLKHENYINSVKSVITLLYPEKSKNRHCENESKY